MSTTTDSFGPLLREWRQRRRVSQLDLALEGNISARHLSFLENGRAKPSREMVLALAEQLEVPLRDRNVLLAAAGYAPVFSERTFDDPRLGAVREAVLMVLHGHEPYPALAVDRHWNLVAANRAVGPLIGGLDPSIWKPPVNVMRAALHPEGLAPRIVNLPEWREHVLERIRRQVEDTGDPALAALLDELRSYPVPRKPGPPRPGSERGGLVIPFALATEFGVLSFFGTVTVFGTPLDVTLSELALECFYPADAQTAAVMRRLGASDQTSHVQQAARTVAQPMAKVASMPGARRTGDRA